MYNIKIHTKVKTKGVIFDFNGTLFWDTPYHDRAWDIFLDNHKISLTRHEKMQKIHGKINTDIFKGIFEKDFSSSEIEDMTLEKEKIYHQICLTKKMEYAPGAFDFINYLKSQNIQYTIATSSGWENIEFYIKHMELEKWFDLDKLVYSDGSFRGKPHPDIFIKAIDKLQLKAQEILIFEDSPAGIQAAQNSGAQVVIVNSDHVDYSAWKYPVITHFNDALQYLE